MTNRNKGVYQDTIIYCVKTEIMFSDEVSRILNGQSKICNWLYNRLYEMVEYDYKNNDGAAGLTRKFTLRDQVPVLKRKYPFLKTVYSSVSKNVALRLAGAYKAFFEGKCDHPHFRSQKKKWFSLEYEEKAGWVVDGRDLTLSLGKDENNKQIRVQGILKSKINVDNAKSFRLVKERDRFYGVFTIVEKKREVKESEKWISIDPNHKNLFISIDRNGESIEFDNLAEIKYWDAVCDNLRSRRDLCKRKSVFVSTDGRRGYWKPSKRWVKYNEAYKRAMLTRREQIKLGMFTIANYLCRHYDVIMIGDYVPNSSLSTSPNMSRGMLNQSVIGKLRSTIKWVCEKSGKKFIKTDEKFTTMKCSNCGHMEKKLPDIRVFTCKSCGKTFHRDINSAINIAKNNDYLPCTGYVEEPTYTAHWSHKDSRVEKLNKNRGRFLSNCIGVNKLVYV